jgi:hypothetical protein
MLLKCIMIGLMDNNYQCLEVLHCLKEKSIKIKNNLILFNIYDLNTF